MVHFLHNRTSAASYDELLGLFSDADLASPNRSTVPLLQLLRDPINALEALGSVIGQPIQLPARLSLEFEVPVRRGSGKPSCTDLMILSPSASIGIEAKFTEPPYETVQEWLGASGSDNRRAVLAGWLEYIGQATKAPMNPAEIASLPYQMVHRTASVCSVDPERPILVYLVFGTAGEYYARQLGALRAALGGVGHLRIALIECPLETLPAADVLRQRWSNGQRNLGQDVRAALRAGPLFKLGSLRSVPIEVSLGA